MCGAGGTPAICAPARPAVSDAPPGSAPPGVVDAVLGAAGGMMAGYVTARLLPAGLGQQPLRVFQRPPHEHVPRNHHGDGEGGADQAPAPLHVAVCVKHQVPPCEHAHRHPQSTANGGLMRDTGWMPPKRAGRRQRRGHGCREPSLLDSARGAMALRRARHPRTAARRAGDGTSAAAWQASAIATAVLGPPRKTAAGRARVRALPVEANSPPPPLCNSMVVVVVVGLQESHLLAAMVWAAAWLGPTLPTIDYRALGGGWDRAHKLFPAGQGTF